MGEIVFANRVRCAYARKRTAREMVRATLLILAVMAACGIAGTIDKDRGEVTAAQRARIVASWSQPVVSPVVVEGE